MENRKHTNVLNKELKELGYFLDELSESQSEYEFFQIVALYIVPLLQQSPGLEFFRQKYIQDKDAYVKLRNELEAKAPEEIESVFLSLKKATTNAKLLDNPEVKTAIESIEHVFSNKNQYIMPSYLVTAYEKQNRLFELLLDLNQKDIVEPYALIQKKQITQHNPVTRLPEEVERFEICHFTYAPSLDQLRELDGIWHYKDLEAFWIAWEYLAFAEWCWITPQSFFENRSLNFNELEAHNESLHLMSLHTHWWEMNHIKTGNHRTRVFFQRENFSRFLKLIINDIILQQGITKRKEINEVKKEAFRPYIIELRLHYTHLLLDVKWQETGATYTYELHSFQDGSGPHNFITALLDSPGQKIDLSKVSKTSGGTVAKYFNDMGLTPILARLFFDKKTTDTTALLTKTIICQDLSKKEVEDLTETIRKLQPHGPTMIPGEAK